jgi:hypothetical protein
MPTTPNLLEIGCRSGATIGAMYIQQVMSLPVTKSDDDILTLTT